MGKNTKVILLMEKNMGLEFTNGQMDRNILVVGLKMRWKGKELIHGVMEEFMKVPGSKTS